MRPQSGDDASGTELSPSAPLNPVPVRDSIRMTWDATAVCVSSASSTPYKLSRSQVQVQLLSQRGEFYGRSKGPLTRERQRRRGPPAYRPSAPGVRRSSWMLQSRITWPPSRYTLVLKYRQSPSLFRRYTFALRHHQQRHPWTGLRHAGGDGLFYGNIVVGRQAVHTARVCRQVLEHSFVRLSRHLEFAGD